MRSLRITATASLVGSLALTAPSLGGFVGWTSVSRVSGSTLLVDVFANFDSPSARLLNVYNADIALDGGQFVQQTSIGRKGWAPQADQTASDADCFMTIGGVEYGGDYYAASATAGDPDFLATAGAWSGSIGSAPSNSVPVGAGWYHGSPGSSESWAVDLSTMSGSAGGVWQRRAGNFGIWVAHFAINLSNLHPTPTLRFEAGIGYRTDALPGNPVLATSSGLFQLPTPGVLAVLGLAGLRGPAGRRRAS